MLNLILGAIIVLLLLLLVFTNKTHHKSDFTDRPEGQDTEITDLIDNCPKPKKDNRPIDPYINVLESSEVDKGVPTYSTDEENAQLVLDSLNYNVHPHAFITYWKHNPQLIVVEMYKHPDSIIGNTMENLVKNVEKITAEEKQNIKYVYNIAPNNDPNGDSVYKYSGFYKYKYYGHLEPNALKEWILSVVN